MIGFRLSAQRPPEAKRIKEDVVMRFDHVYEVDPALMTGHTPQQDIPAGDTRRAFVVPPASWGKTVRDGARVRHDSPAGRAGTW